MAGKTLLPQIPTTKPGLATESSRSAFTRGLTGGAISKVPSKTLEDAEANRQAAIKRKSK